MTSKLFTGFKGLDRRRPHGMADQQTALVADNLYLNSAGSYVTRPGYEKVYQLPEETAGLYGAAGALRAIAPAGFEDIFNEQQPNMLFDFVGPNYARDEVESVVGTELFGAAVGIGAQAFAAVRRRSTGKLEYHWFTDRPDSPGDATANSQVIVPFQPTGNIIRLAGKIVGVDNAAGVVRFSSTEFGARDWTAELDAGFLPAVARAPGDRILTGVGHFRGRLAVFFADSVQVWAFDPDPLNHELTSVLNGPGTLDPRSITNVLGDLIFFSRGGFRSMTTQSITGELQEGDIGAQIWALTQGLSGQATAATWWQKLGVFLCAFGSTVFCFTLNRETKVTGWTRWQIPAGEITDFAQDDTDLYFRTADHGVYRFDIDLDTDDGSPTEWRWRSQYHHFDRPGTFKTFTELMLRQTGAAYVTYLPDPNNESVMVPVYTTSDITPPQAKIPLLAMSDALALELSGAGRWQLDGYAIDFDQGV